MRHLTVDNPVAFFSIDPLAIPENLVKLEDMEQYDASDPANRLAFKGRLARNLLRLLIHGPQLGAADIIEDPVLKRAIDKHRDPEFLQCLREEIQQGLDRAFNSLSHGHSGDAEVQQLFIEHVLNFIPIITPGDMQTLRVPQWITDRWLQVEYRIEPIELTGKAFNVGNKVHSFGLVPQHASPGEINHGARAHLLHMGTTIPTADGCKTQVLTNFMFFLEVGAFLWWSGKNNIHCWLQRMKSLDLKVNMSGVSLGADLVIMTARHAPDSSVFDRVTAINPAPLMLPPFYELVSNKAKSPNNSGHWQVVTQVGDPLSLAGGYYPYGWRRVEMCLGESSQQSARQLPKKASGLMKHIGVLSGMSGTHVAINREKSFAEILCKNGLLNVVQWGLTCLIRATLLILTLVKMSVGCIKNSCCGKKAIESDEAPAPSLSMA
ncbi:MAG: hypothetical protein P1U63_13455 [Coxiellaceae bacterium]|nr:hypothetical protein [Coxiellaceae bacterium]